MKTLKSIGNEEKKLEELVEELETKQEFYSCGANACGINK